MVIALLPCITQYIAIPISDALRPILMATNFDYSNYGNCIKNPDRPNISIRR
jgi:hypothetical protein